MDPCFATDAVDDFVFSRRIGCIPLLHVSTAILHCVAHDGIPGSTQYQHQLRRERRPLLFQCPESRPLRRRSSRSTRRARRQLLPLSICLDMSDNVENSVTELIIETILEEQNRIWLDWMTGKERIPLSWRGSILPNWEIPLTGSTSITGYPINKQPTFSGANLGLSMGQSELPN